MTDLTDVLREWRPEPTTTVDRVGPWPARAFTALLDLPDTAQDVLPPLWHWFHFHDTPRRSALGEDGHPRDSAFLPPIPERRQMFAGGRVRWHEPIRFGDEVERRSAVRDVVVKEGRIGPMAFVTVRHEFHRHDRLLVDEEQDLVYRSGAVKPTTREEPPAEGVPLLEFDTDPVALFQFSALTYNAHRIHYDHRYVTEVEGYPGLVVHGPLLALLLLEVPRRAGRRPESFSYRLTRPLFAGTRVVVARGPAGELTAGAAGAPASITGAVTEKA